MGRVKAKSTKSRWGGLMTKKEKPHAGAGQANQQGAENIKVDNLSKQNTLSSSASQEQATVDNSAESQRKRLLSHLYHAPLTTLQARERLDIMAPAARVMELRKRGHDIKTVWTWDLSPSGKAHRVARYILQRR